MHLHRLTAGAILALFVSACGGGAGFDALPDDFTDAGSDTVPGGEDFSSDPSNPAGEAGPVTLDAEPAQAWVEVEGQRIEYGISDIQHYSCNVGDDQITINFQTADGQNLLIQGGDLGQGWILNLTFTSRDVNNVSYGGTLPGDGSLGLGDDALSFEGTVQRVEDFDLANATDVDVRLAVNCVSPGGDPTATVGGVEYVVPFSGAQSVTCEVSADSIEVRINRLGLDGIQLEISGSFDGTSWLGSATVYKSDGNLTSTFGPDVDGPVVDGATVTYTGTFSSDSGDADGTMSITCP